MERIRRGHKFGVEVVPQDGNTFQNLKYKEDDEETLS